MLKLAKQWLDFAERDRTAAVALATHDDLLGIAATARICEAVASELDRPAESDDQKT